MTLPYKTRLMTRIGDTVIELARFQRRAFASDIRFHTVDLTTPWWQETPLSDSETITPRWEFPASADAKRSREYYARKHKK